MRIQTILALVDGDSGSDTVMRTAIAAGQNFDAYVEMLHVEADPNSALIVPGDGLSGGAVEQIMEGIRAGAEERLTAARHLYEKHCVSAGLPLSENGADDTEEGFTVRFHHLTGEQTDEIAARGKLFDLIVLAQPGGDGGASEEAALEAALFDTGRPVLVVPPNASPTIGRNVSVAWNGTAESTRAIMAAFPFLEQASEICVIAVDEDNGPTDLKGLTTYLSRHGMQAATRTMPSDGRTVSEILLREAGDEAESLLVMGAYGHSRLRELVLGGATRGVLRDAKVPVLMAH